MIHGEFSGVPKSLGFGFAQGGNKLSQARVGDVGHMGRGMRGLAAADFIPLDERHPAAGFFQQIGRRHAGDSSANHQHVDLAAGWWLGKFGLVNSFLPDGLGFHDIQ